MTGTGANILCYLHWYPPQVRVDIYSIFVVDPFPVHRSLFQLHVVQMTMCRSCFSIATIGFLASRERTVTMISFFAFGLTATVHRWRIPGDQGGLLHPCQEAGVHGRGTNKGLWDRQHQLTAGAEKPKGFTWTVHWECKKRTCLQPVWINSIFLSFKHYNEAMSNHCQIVWDFKMTNNEFIQLDSASPQLTSVIIKSKKKKDKKKRFGSFPETIGAFQGAWGGKGLLCNNKAVFELLLWLCHAGSRSSHGCAQNLDDIWKGLAVDPNQCRGCLPKAARWELSTRLGLSP